MMTYEEQACVHCEEHTVLYHQSVADACCESCGEWQEEE